MINCKRVSVHHVEYKYILIIYNGRGYYIQCSTYSGIEYSYRKSLDLYVSDV